MWNTYIRVVMSSRYKIVVQGEASETDSDDEVYITSLPPQTTSVGLKVVQCLNLPPPPKNFKTVYLISLIYMWCFFWSWTLLGSWGGIWNRQWWRGAAAGPDLSLGFSDTPERPTTTDRSPRPTRYTVSCWGQAEPLTQDTWWERLPFHNAFVVFKGNSFC